jgi:hypothetical protein
MIIENIAQSRLQAQLISDRKFTKPEEVVSWMCAMQAQDYPGSKWSIGLRLNEASVRDIDIAIQEKRIIRTWPMRGTLHFVAAPDVRWMLDLLAPRVIASSARRHRQLELDGEVFSQTRKLILKVLKENKQITRQALFEVFESSKIASRNQRGIHIIQQHALEGMICFGPHEGKQPTFILMDEWVPKTQKLLRDEALYILALRYFTSHGPATLKDFIWWSGLITSDARTAIESARDQLSKVIVNGNEYWFNPNTEKLVTSSLTAYLLPGYDEFILGYTNRSDIIDSKYMKRITPGGGLFIPTIVIYGKIAGTWKRIPTKKKISIEKNPFKRFTADQRMSVMKEEERFLGFVSS